METLASLFVKIGADVTDFEKQMKKMQKDLQGMGDSLTGVGESMSVGFTVPLTALGAAGATVAADMQKSQGMIQASLGLTSEEAAKLNETAKTLWSEGFGESMNEVSAGIINVQQNMKNISTEQLQSVTEQAMTLAQLMGEDLNNVTKTANALMEHFGLTAQEAFDLMAVGQQKGLNYSGEMLDTLNEYAVHFKALGFTGQEFFNTLVAGSEAGAFNLDKVGDAVKEFTIRTKDGSDTTKEAFEALNLNADQMMTTFAEGGPKAADAFQMVIKKLTEVEDPVLRNQIGVALLGTQYEDLEKDVVAALGTTQNQLGMTEGATQRAGQAMHDNFGDRTTQLWRDFLLAMEPVGVVLLDMAEDWMPKLSAAIETLANWFGNLSPTMQQVVVVGGAVLAALGPLIMIAGSLATAVSTLIPVWRAFNLVLASNPIGMVVVAIGLLVAAGIYLTKNWDEVKAKASELWDRIKQVFSNVKKTAGEWGRNLVEGFKNGIHNMISVAVSKAREMADSVASTVKDFFGIHSPSKLMQEFGQYVAEGLANGIGDNTPTVQEKANLMAQSITSAMNIIDDKLSVTAEISKAKFDLIKAKMGENADEATLLQAELDELNSLYEVQTEKVSIAQEAYNRMKAAKGDANVETQKLYLNLIQEQTALANLANQLGIVEGKWIDATKAKSSYNHGSGTWDTDGNFTPGSGSGGGGGVLRPDDDGDGWEWEDGSDYEGPVDDDGLPGGGGRGEGQNEDNSYGNGAWKPGHNPWEGSNSFHTGGLVTKLGPREIPAVLEEGEYVLPRKLVKNGLGGGGITQHITINSPVAHSPSEEKRKYLQVARQLAMEWGV